MRELLEKVARGELSPAGAEAELRGYVTSDAGRYDAAREHRRGVPEAILADEKPIDAVADLVGSALSASDRALVTRLADADAVRAALAPDWPEASWRYHPSGRVLSVHAPDYDPVRLDATVAVVAAGTADAGVAAEAATVAGEMGAAVDRIDDVGVASIARLLDQRDRIAAADVVVVAAGREGALPTVVAGLVDAPVVGVPVSTGYGTGGAGRAALEGMLQSCTVLSVVNVDAGFVAGAQAGLVCRALDAARAEN